MNEEHVYRFKQPENPDAFVDTYRDKSDAKKYAVGYIMHFLEAMPGYESTLFAVKQSYDMGLGPTKLFKVADLEFSWQALVDEGILIPT